MPVRQAVRIMAESKSKLSGPKGKYKHHVAPLTKVKGQLRTCAVCHKSVARFCCAYCDGPSLPHPLTYQSPNYCSKKCQKSAWPLHEFECRRFQQRRAIYRIASLVQALFNLWCEISYSFQLGSVQAEEDRAFVKGWSDNSAFTKNGSVGEPLPVANVLTEDWKGAVLAFHFRNDAHSSGGSWDLCFEVMICTIYPSFSS